jgi:hypothetical protein
MVPVPYNDDHGGIYVDVPILLPSETTKFKLAIVQDGTAMEHTWFWPQSFWTDKQCIKESGICARAKQVIKETIARAVPTANIFRRRNAIRYL